MKTKIDLENKVWYRLVKVIYIGFVLLVLGISAMLLIGDGWYRDDMYVFSDDRVAEMRTRVENDQGIKSARFLERNKSRLDYKTLAQYPYGVSISSIVAIDEAGYSISGAEIRDECYQYDNPYMSNYDIDVEMKKFNSGSSAIFCKGWIHDKYLELSEAYASEIRMGLAIIPYLDTFYTDPNGSSIWWIADTAKSTDLQNALRMGKDTINLGFFAWQIPMRIGIFIIELLIFLLIIPKVFFYIVLGKQH